MRLRKNTAKITMTLFITLALSFLTIGCGSTKPDAAAEKYLPKQYIQLAE